MLKGVIQIINQHHFLMLIEIISYSIRKLQKLYIHKQIWFTLLHNSRKIFIVVIGRL